MLADNETFRHLVTSKKVAKGKGCGAIRGIAEKFPHPNIVDLKLSQMTGSNVRQKAVPLNPDMMVLLLTGTYDSNVSIQSFFPTDCDHYVKPCGRDERLQRHVMDCFRGSKRNRGGEYHKAWPD